MRIDGTSFNQQWAWGKTEAEFINEFKDIDHIFPDANDKTAKLKETHALLQQGKPADFKMPKAPVVIPPAGANASPAKTGAGGSKAEGQA